MGEDWKFRIGRETSSVSFIAYQKQAIKCNWFLSDPCYYCNKDPVKHSWYRMSPPQQLLFWRLIEKHIRLHGKETLVVKTFVVNWVSPVVLIMIFAFYILRINVFINKNLDIWQVHKDLISTWFHAKPSLFILPTPANYRLR